jgi:hypothetical protein
LLSVVNGILDMSKIESGNFEIAGTIRAAPGDFECQLLGYKARNPESSWLPICLKAYPNWWPTSAP